MTYQPRFIAYAMSLGKSPEDVERSFDNRDYIAWINPRWREWEKETQHPGYIHSEEDHLNFNNWLLEKPRP